jgi:micrococcal nuclease
MRYRRGLPKFKIPRRPGQALLVVGIVLAAAAVQHWRPDLFQSSPAPPATNTSASSSDAAGTYRIQRVVDGDTLVLVGVKEHVRLIGANTPETVKQNTPVQPWGPEATAFTKKFLAGGEVRIEFDGSHHDKYGRLLALVYVGDRMLNEELIREGLAKAETQYSYSAAMKSRFRRAEAEAKAARRGIWSEK